MENVYLALIVAVPAMLSPLLMAMLQNRNRRIEKIADYARQDKVAADVALVAKKLLERQDMIAAKATTAAVLLEQNNMVVAATAAETQDQLRVIHSLVNSNMTSSLQSELDARRVALALMIELSDLRRGYGSDPSDVTVQEIGAIKGRIAELEALLSDRLKQSKEIDAAMAQGSKTQ